MTAASYAPSSASAGALQSIGTLGDAAGFTTTDIEILETLAVTMIRERKLDRAEDCLRMACLLDHARPGLWVRLGDCRRLGKNFAAALDSYELAAEVGATPDAWLSIKKAICYLALDRKEQAFALLEEAEQLADRQADDVSAKQFLTALLASVGGPDAGKSEA
jgi:tetratricopeptide (TPR) repeat protein